MPCPSCAFATLLTTDSYLPGALTLAAALRDVHAQLPAPNQIPFETVCLVTPETVDVKSIKALRKVFDVVVGVEILEFETNQQGLSLLGAYGGFVALSNAFEPSPVLLSSSSSPYCLLVSLALQPIRDSVLGLGPKIPSCLITSLP
jgi:hypothetical protein